MLTRDQLNKLIGDWLLDVSPTFNACAMVERLALDNRTSVDQAIALTTFGYISADLDRAAWILLAYIVALAVTCAIIPLTMSRRGGAAPTKSPLDPRLCERDRHEAHDGRFDPIRTAAAIDVLTHQTSPHGNGHVLQPVMSHHENYDAMSSTSPHGIRRSVAGEKRIRGMAFDDDAHHGHQDGDDHHNHHDHDDDDDHDHLDNDVDGGFGAREHGISRSFVEELVAAVDVALAL